MPIPLHWNAQQDKKPTNLVFFLSKIPLRALRYWYKEEEPFLYGDLVMIASCHCELLQATNFEETYKIPWKAEDIFFVHISVTFPLIRDNRLFNKLQIFCFFRIKTYCVFFVNSHTSKCGFTIIKNPLVVYNESTEINKNLSNMTGRDRSQVISLISARGNYVFQLMKSLLRLIAIIW